jgi:hypothetical protein
LAISDSPFDPVISADFKRIHIIMIFLLFGFQRIAALIWWCLLVVVVVLGGLIWFGSTLLDQPAPPAKVQAAPHDLIDYGFEQ